MQGINILERQPSYTEDFVFVLRNDDDQNSLVDAYAPVAQKLWQDSDQHKKSRIAVNGTYGVGKTTLAKKLIPAFVNASEHTSLLGNFSNLYIDSSEKSLLHYDHDAVRTNNHFPKKCDGNNKGDEELDDGERRQLEAHYQAIQDADMHIVEWPYEDLDPYYHSFFDLQSEGFPETDDMWVRIMCCSDLIGTNEFHGFLESTAGLRFER